MTISFWYWLFFVIGLLFSGWGWWSIGPDGRRLQVIGGGFLLWVLLFLLGLKVFGTPIKG